MLRVGLTGGIASGKSTVAVLLRDYEYPVLDADTIARELLEPGQDAYNEVVREFGGNQVTTNYTATLSDGALKGKSETIFARDFEGKRDGQ